MPQTNNSTEHSIGNQPHITANILARTDDYIMISKNELKMADASIKSNDIVSEALIMLASLLAGYLVNMLPNSLTAWSISALKNISLLQIILIILVAILFTAGFYLKNQKTSLLKDILERYKTNTQNITQE